MGGGMLVFCLICPTHLMKCMSVHGLCVYKRERENVSFVYIWSENVFNFAQHFNSVFFHYANENLDARVA